MNDEFLLQYDMLPDGVPVLCAVSGGSDSIYLLCRLLERGVRVTAAHFNHRLRGAEADRDEEFVRGFCAQRGVACIIGSGDTAAYAAAKGLGIEDAARRLRYAFLHEAAASIHAARIATAHTADDQLETMLLNLARGSGLRGLCGIPPRNGIVVRPILTVPRSEIVRWLEAHGISHVEDSSNAEACYARNRLRHQALPALQSVNAAAAAHAASAGLLLREDEQYLQDTARAFLSEQPEPDVIVCAALMEQPFPIASRAVRLACGTSLSLAQVRSVLALCKGKKNGRLSLPGTQAVLENGLLRFGAPAICPIEPREVLPGVSFELPQAGLRLSCRLLAQNEEIHECFNIFYFQSDAICGKVICKSRSPGDEIRLAGHGCTKSLKKLFQQARIPPTARAHIPVLYDDRGPIAVAGFGTAERVAAADAGSPILCVCFSPIPGSAGQQPR